MAFEYDLHDKLREKIKKLGKKDPQRAEILHKKIKQIKDSSLSEIEHYKNLGHNLSSLKRVHIDKSFVLTFEVNRQKNKILFVDFDHHDKVYNRGIK